ncbi:arylsulfatase [Sediminitomix flava]|uniref:Arylsulfatase A n=1 Tax=Sediminitomix flava TaxID=379075 RepID=A0A315ZAS5_SEDFL|nr:arylsulfatase [Sediminitomix flava]PWJ41928.1 arylsulfatase A [Sediminitomix flava]
MLKQSFLKKIILVGLCLIGVQSVQAQKQRPNVVIVMADDQGYGDLGITGNEYISTPNIDNFAEENITFDRFMVNAVCAPTRASFLTGRHNLATGVNWVTRRKEVMNSEEVTIAELFKTYGYKTGLFGKWHNGAQYPHNPVGQGFDTFLGFCAGHWNNYFDTKLENEKGEFVQTKGYIADVLTDHAISFIEENNKEPFLCFVPYNTPHAPFQVADEYFDKYKKQGLDDRTAAVYGMVENIDDNVGRLIQSLKDNGLWENTIFIYTSDNGPNGERYNAGMKGKKATVHEGGVRVPFFMKVPGYGEGNIKELTAHIDILPTISTLCNVEVPSELDIHGSDLSPLLKGQSWEERTIFTHNQPWNFEEAPAGAVRTEQYRLVFSKDNDTTLYDMQIDPNQELDISAKHPQVVEDLGKAYHEWFIDVTSGGHEPKVPRIEVGDTEYVYLPAVDGKTKNKVRYQGKGWSNDWAKNFKNKKGVISWDLKVVEDGEYTFDALYSLSESFTGFKLILELGEQQLSASMTDAFVSELIPSPDREERTEVHEYTWGTKSVGKLFLKKGKYSLKVRVSNEIDPKNDFRLKEIIIKGVTQS